MLALLSPGVKQVVLFEPNPEALLIAAENAILFGWNAVPRSEGTVNLGDGMRIVKAREDRWPMKIRA